MTAAAQGGQATRSESGFGALDAFAVLAIGPAGLRQLALKQEIRCAYDWQIDGRADDACIDLSAVSWETLTGDLRNSRERFHAENQDRWRVEPGRCNAA